MSVCAPPPRSDPMDRPASPPRHPSQTPQTPQCGATGCGCRRWRTTATRCTPATWATRRRWPRTTATSRCVCVVVVGCCRHRLLLPSCACVLVVHCWRTHTSDAPSSSSLAPFPQQANFDHAQRFRKAFLERWGADFDIATVCFDYFYIPSEWANTRWGTGACMHALSFLLLPVSLGPAPSLSPCVYVCSCVHAPPPPHPPSPLQAPS